MLNDYRKNGKFECNAVLLTEGKEKLCDKVLTYWI